MRHTHFTSFLLIFFLVGCGTTKVYKEILNDKPSYNSKSFSVSSDDLYQAVLKTVFSKNFVVEKEDKENGFLVAKRFFQKRKKTIIVALQAKIISQNEDHSLLYLNALQTTEKLYVADRTRFFMFLIPLPGGGGKEATKVKAGEMIVEDAEFYADFFKIIEKELPKVYAKEEIALKEPIPEEEIAQEEVLVKKSHQEEATPQKIEMPSEEPLISNTP